jgi:hypothetical protein
VDPFAVSPSDASLFSSLSWLALWLWLSPLAGPLVWYASMATAKIKGNNTKASNLAVKSTSKAKTTLSVVDIDEDRAWEAYWNARGAGVYFEMG